MAFRFLENSLLGNPLRKEEDYIIVGGGIAGLLLGYQFKRQEISFQLQEKTAQAGGLLETVDTQWGIIEKSATGFLWSPAIAEMSRRLQLEMMPPGPDSSTKYIVKDRKLQRLPVSTGAMINAAFRLLYPRNKNPQTIREFSDLYLGRDFSDFIVNPAMGGIYAADIDDLSFPGALKTIAKLQQKYPFLPQAIWKSIQLQRNKKHKGTHSFEKGLGELCAALTKYLDGLFSYKTNGLHRFEKNHPTILTIPSYTAAEFFAGHPLAALLKQIAYIPVISVNFIFSRSALHKLKRGFGCVIPRTEGMESLGILFKHDIFPGQMKQDVLNLTCIVRDNYKEEKLTILPKSEAEISNLIMKELDMLFGIKENPLYAKVNKYRNGIPLYSPIHYSNLFEIDHLLKKDFPNVRLFGNYTGEISIRGMCDTASAVTPNKNENT